VKTTLEIPDALFRATKARAASRGESLKSYVCEALRARLESEGAIANEAPGWRRVFGRARADEVREVDAVLEDELEHVEAEDWL
jgi:plasmid stability protein